MLGSLIVSIGADISALASAVHQAQAQMAGIASAAQAAAQVSGAAFAALGAGAAASLQQFSAFEAQMNQVGAVSDATTEQMRTLTEQALELGAKTQFSASQAAAGMGELAKAGFTAQETMAAIPGVLDLAAAGGVSVAQAAEVAGGALRGFGLAASQAGEVADVLAKAANLSAVSISDLQGSIKYIAPVAQVAGQSMQEMAAMLGVLGNAMIKGEQAGTSLRQIMIRLSDPPKRASEELAKLGISLQDAQGHMLPLSNVVEQLRQKTAGMTDAQRTAALAHIAGTESLSAMAAMVKTTREEMSRMELAMLNNAGASQEMATKMNAGIGAAFEQMKGSIEVVATRFGEQLAPAARTAMGAVQSAAEAIGKLDPTILRAGAAMTTAALAFTGGLAVVSLAVAGLTAVVLPAGMALAGMSAILGFNLVPAVIALGAPLVALAAGVGLATFRAGAFNTAAADSAKQAQQQTQDLQGLVQEFERLQRAVAPTVAEKKRLQAVTEKLIAISPALISGWDAQGNAVGIVTGEVNRLSGAYQRNAAEAIKAAKAAALVAGQQATAARVAYTTELATANRFAKAASAAPRKATTMHLPGGRGDYEAIDAMSRPAEMLRQTSQVANAQIPILKKAADEAAALHQKMQREIGIAEGTIRRASIFQEFPGFDRARIDSANPYQGRAAKAHHAAMGAAPHLTAEQKQVQELAKVYQDLGRASDAAARRLNLHGDAERWAKEQVAAHEQAINRANELGEKHEKLNVLFREQEGVRAYEDLAKSAKEAIAVQREYEGALSRAEVIFAATGDEAELLASKVRAAEKQFNSLADAQAKLPKGLQDSEALRASASNIAALKQQQKAWQDLQDDVKAFDDFASKMSGAAAAGTTLENLAERARIASTYAQALGGDLTATAEEQAAAAATARGLWQEYGQLAEAQQRASSAAQAHQQTLQALAVGGIGVVTSALEGLGLVSGNAGQQLMGMAGSVRTLFDAMQQAKAAADAMHRAIAAGAGKESIDAAIKANAAAQQQLDAANAQAVGQGMQATASLVKDLFEDAQQGARAVEDASRRVSEAVVKLNMDFQRSGSEIERAKALMELYQGAIDNGRLRVEQLSTELASIPWWKEKAAEDRAELERLLPQIDAWNAKLAATRDAYSSLAEAAGAAAAAEAEQAYKRSIEGPRRVVPYGLPMMEAQQDPSFGARRPLDAAEELAALAASEAERARVTAAILDMEAAKQARVNEEIIARIRLEKEYADTMRARKATLNASLVDLGVYADAAGKLQREMNFFEQETGPFDGYKLISGAVLDDIRRAEEAAKAFQSRVAAFAQPFAQALASGIQAGLNAATWDLTSFEQNLMLSLRGAVVSAFTDAFSAQMIMPKLQPLLTQIVQAMEYIDKASGANRKARMDVVGDLVGALGAEAKSLMATYQPLIEGTRKALDAAFGLPGQPGGGPAVSGGSGGGSSSGATGASGSLFPFRVDGGLPPAQTSGDRTIVLNLSYQGGVSSADADRLSRMVVESLQRQGALG